MDTLIEKVQTLLVDDVETTINNIEEFKNSTEITEEDIIKMYDIIELEGDIELPDYVHSTKFKVLLVGALHHILEKFITHHTTK